MIRVQQRISEGTAYQFTEASIDTIRGMVLPTGVVTVQVANELNRVPARCYVPTAWGAAVLELGDWFVVLDNNIVRAIPAEQMDLLFEALGESSSPEEPAIEPITNAVVFRGVAGELSTTLALQTYFEDYRLDYVETVATDSVDFSILDSRVILVNATGTVVVAFDIGDMLLGYADGRMEVIRGSGS